MSHDDDEDEAEAEPPVDQQPRFTKQDEERELASLTIEDIFKIQADLLGVETITGGLAGLGIVGNASATNGTDAPANRTNTCKTYISPKKRELLMALEQELANPNMPPAQLSAYSQATVRCPDEVSNAKKLAFVEHEGGNIPEAARRLIRYWNFRLELFGDDRCYLPMTLLGAMQDEMMNIADRLVWQLLPNTDAAGRGILHCKVANRNLSQYTMKEEFRAFFYFAHCLMEDDRTRRKGFVQMVDGRHIVRQHFTRKFPKYIESFDKSFPIQMRAVHICYPSRVLFYIIHPVVHRLAPKNIRLRVKMHHGSTPSIALEAGGFIFVTKAGQKPTDSTRIDQQGVSLKQRKNNLCRRLRIEKNKKEMKRKGGEEQSAQAMDPLNDDDLSLGDISDFEVPLDESIFDSGP